MPTKPASAAAAPAADESTDLKSRRVQALLDARKLFTQLQGMLSSDTPLDPAARLNWLDTARAFCNGVDVLTK